MADSRDITGKNRKFTGTDSIELPVGTTGERVASGSGDKGKIRFNSTTNLSEYYDGSVWKSIDAPPVVNSISPTLVEDPDGSTVTNITVTGTGFSTTTQPTVTFRSTVDGTVFTATQVTVNSATQLVAATLGTMVTGKSPYSVRVTNPSELFGQLDSGLTLDGTQVFATAAGSIGTVNSLAVNPTLSPVTAVDPDGDNITYSIQSGALPTGLSLNSSTGAITGTAGSLSAGTASFTIAAATNAQTVTRAFTITMTNNLYVAATGGTVATQGDYKVHTFTSSSQFAVSQAGNSGGSSSVEYLVVAGGGGGGADNGGAGGGGGFRTNYPSPATGGLGVSAQTYAVTVGAGATTANPSPRGSNSVFSTITSTGGGGSGSCNQAGPSRDGGSGAGGSQHGQSGGSGNSPSVSPPQGNPGHPGSPNPGGGGGGGGAGQSGNAYSGQAGGPGGNGTTNSITGSSVTYAGGGGGGCGQNNNSNGGAAGSGGGGRGGGGGPGTGSGSGGEPGTANTGGGGGGGGQCPQQGGNGGSGIVVVRYKFQN